jgi:hypothetical protein
MSTAPTKPCSHGLITSVGLTITNTIFVNESIIIITLNTGTLPNMVFIVIIILNIYKIGNLIVTQCSDGTGKIIITGGK